MRVKDTFHFSRGQVKKKSRSSSFLCLSLLRNDKETVATQAKRLFKICFLVHAFLVCSSSQTLVLTLVYSEIGSDQHESTFLSNPSFRASMLHWVHLQFCKFKKVDYKDSVKAGHLATYVASPLGICHPRLKKGKGRGRGRKMRKGKGTLSPQFLPWLCANPGHARAATDVDVFETFASVYKHHNQFNHFKSKVNILWRTSLWFDI